MPCPAANITYHFECDNRVFTQCEQVAGPEGGRYTIVSGTCTNPASREICAFHDAWVTRTFPGYCGGNGAINCSSCFGDFSYGTYGFYPDCGNTAHPDLEVSCWPGGCIPGCPFVSDSDASAWLKWVSLWPQEPSLVPVF